MKAAAIWWRIKHEDNHSLKPTRVLHARGEHGTATFHVSGSPLKVEAQLYTFNGVLEADAVSTRAVRRASYSEDNANPRRQGSNTITRTQALKLAADMIEACKVRLQEASELYKVDPSMRDLYVEQGEARFLSAAIQMQEVFAKNPEPTSWIDGRHNPIYGKLIDHNQAMQEAFDSEDAFVNPWVDDTRSARANHLDRATHDEHDKIVELRRERIYFVLGLIGDREASGS